MVYSIQVQSQYSKSPEGDAVRFAAILAKIPLSISEDPPGVRGVLPVGSVEFVREALRRQGAATLTPVDYPQALLRHMHRAITRTTLAEAAPDAWVKPVEAKAFDPGSPSSLLESGIDPATPVWASEVVTWLCEYRCYICRDRLIWMSRYDPDGDDDAPAPNLDVIGKMVAEYASSGDAPIGYSLDVGVLSTGETALVEINDGYGIGFYGPIEMSHAKNYLDLLLSRYQQIMEAA